MFCFGDIDTLSDGCAGFITVIKAPLSLGYYSNGSPFYRLAP